MQLMRTWIWINRGSFFFKYLLKHHCQNVQKFQAPDIIHNQVLISLKLLLEIKLIFLNISQSYWLQFLTPLAQSFVFNSYERLRSFLTDLIVRKGLEQVMKNLFKNLWKKMAHRACEAKLRRVLPKGCYLWGLKNIFKTAAAVLLHTYYISNQYF